MPKFLLLLYSDPTGMQRLSPEDMQISVPIGAVSGGVAERRFRQRWEASNVAPMRG